MIADRRPRDVVTPCLVLAARQRHENLQIVDPSFRGLLVQCGAFNTKTSLQLSLGR